MTSLSSSYKFRKQVVAVIGAAGQVGTPLTKTLLELGHEVRLLIRKPMEQDKTGKLQGFVDKGATTILVPDMNDLQAMTKALEGCEVLICAVYSSEEVLTIAQPIWIQASVAAGVKRFVPTEFGAHTRGITPGDGISFDLKKKVHELIFKSGLGWTFFYNGGIFDYLIPNLRFSNKITTFGNLDGPIYTHEIEDIGRLAAMALTDDRTMNKCVQLDYNMTTQREMVDQLKANFPDYPFEFEHFSSEFITKERNKKNDNITTKGGKESEQKRWGINYVVYVIGKLAVFDDETVRGTELYPDYQVLSKPEMALADPKFVFGSDKAGK